MIAVDISGSYIPLIKTLFPNARIMLGCFHIVQHMNRSLNQAKIQLMKQFDKKSLEYCAFKYCWKLILKESYKLSLTSSYSRAFRETLIPKQCLSKEFKLTSELTNNYNLYQLLLFYLIREEF